MNDLTLRMAAHVSTLTEGVAVLMFIACIALWAGILTGRI